MTNETPKFLSLNPDDFVQGGLVDDVDAVLKTARFEKYDYNGQAQEVLALHISLVTAAGDEYEQYYSAGDLKLYAPSPDGKSVVPVSATGALKLGSNVSQFLTSLINAGFNKNKLADGDISALDGMGAHLIRVAQPERKGLAAPKEDKGPKTVLCVQKILWLPGEKPTFVVGAGTSAAKGAPGNKSVGAPAGAGAPAPAPVQPAAASSASAAEIDDKTTGYIIQVLSENGGSFQKSALPSALFKLCSAAKDPDQPKVLSTAFNPSWISDGNRPWKVDAAGVISLG